MLDLYKPPIEEVAELWDGRIDSETDFKSYRWHQWVDFIDLNQKQEALEDNLKGFCFLGYSCDKGVIRNKGRAGAVKGPESIRKELANLPCRFSENVKLYDAGDIICNDHQLEEAQNALADAVEKIKSLNLFPILLGGGHGIAFGHYKGLFNSIDTQNSCLGIINFDAHFDIRPYPNGGNSGTMFRQIADKCKKEGRDFPYFCVGIQESGNTISLFEKAEDLNTEYILAKNINNFNIMEILEKLNKFIFENDYIYLTICSDVFSSAYAPGVSASNPLGIEPEIALKLIKHIIKSGKVISFDIAEVSPRFDMDNITANLASIIIFAVINTFVNEDVSGK
ncbi:MAG: formimidoylglutamase [Bacillota bacterium]